MCVRYFICLEFTECINRLKMVLNTQYDSLFVNSHNVMQNGSQISNHDDYIGSIQSQMMLNKALFGRHIDFGT